jgi:hypothetical protein
LLFLPNEIPVAQHGLEERRHELGMRYFIFISWFGSFALSCALLCLVDVRYCILIAHTHSFCEMDIRDSGHTWVSLGPNDVALKNT